MSKIVIDEAGSISRKAWDALSPDGVEMRAAAFAAELARRDKLHSARVALMAAEATLLLCAGKVPPYVEDRRAETVAIVRASLKELDG